MQELAPEYILNFAEQLAFVSAFLGGCSAAFLVTLVVIKEKSRAIQNCIKSIALASCFFVITVFCAAMLMITLNTNAPENVINSTSVDMARMILVIAFIIAIYSFLFAIGISGWIYSRDVGKYTTIVAGISAVILTWGVLGF